MLHDARQIRSANAIRAEICVVGAGAAGISFALAFANTSVELCLLESGGLEFDEKTQALYKGEITGRAYHDLDVARLRYFGGTTNAWAGFCRPLDGIDFKVRSYIPHSGWPIAPRDLEPYYRKAHELCELGPYSYEPADYSETIAKFYSERSHDDRVTTKIWKIGPPTRFGKRYRADIVEAPNIHCYLYANLVEIVTNDDATTVSRVRVATLNGTSFWVEANIFVLACGGIETPRLLLASNSKNPAGLGNDFDHVGRYFMLHPKLIVGRVLTSGSSSSLFETERRFERPKILAGLSVSKAQQDAQRVPNHGFVLMSGVRSKGFGALKRLFSGRTGSEISDELRDIMGDLGGIAGKVRDKITGRSAFESLIVQVRMDHLPNPASRLMLGSRRDALGMRQVVVDWRLTTVEKQMLRRTAQILGEVLGALGIGRLQVAEWLSADDDTWPDTPGNDYEYHHMGTTRMSRSPREGVVDADCRVHGVSNLYVASSSVFATAGFSPPTLTIVALALRLAEHIKSRDESDPRHG